MTLKEFSSQYDFKSNIYNTVCLRTAKHGVFIIGTGHLGGDYVTKEDIDDIVAEFDVQFGYDENDNFIGSIYDYELDRIEIEDNILNIYLKTDLSSVADQQPSVIISKIEKEEI